MKAAPGLALAVLLLAGGCSSDGHSDYAQYFKLLRSSVEGSFTKGGVSRDDAAAIPYASMGVRLNGERQSIIVLATDTEGTQLWTSRAHIVIETVQGRVKRTVGLPVDVSVSPVGANPLVPPGLGLEKNFASQRLVDFPSQKTYGLLLDCKAVRRGNQRIVILRRTISTVRVDESCTSRDQRWSFVDTYWLDKDTGFIWKSLQHLHPGGEVLELEIFRPPG